MVFVAMSTSWCYHGLRGQVHILVLPWSSWPSPHHGATMVFVAKSTSWCYHGLRGQVHTMVLPWSLWPSPHHGAAMVFVAKSTSWCYHGLRGQVHILVLPWSSWLSPHQIPLKTSLSRELVPPFLPRMSLFNGQWSWWIRPHQRTHDDHSSYRRTGTKCPTTFPQ